VLRLEEVLDRLLLQPEAYADGEEVAAGLEPYLGVYVADWANHMKEEFRVHAKDGGLALDVPSQMDFRLAPTAEEGVWALAVAPTVRVWFEEDEDGAVDCLRVEQGPLVFEAPRKGTPHAEEVRERDRVTEETAGAFLGRYEDPEADGLARVRIDGDYLAIESADGTLFHLWKVPVEGSWTVRENPFVSITFQKEQGIVVSFTRHLPGGAKLLYPRVE